MNTDTLHFRIGADFGITLMQIAHEHLVYNNDLDKAMNCFTESFGGDVPEEIVRDLLVGKRIILVDEEDQMFNVVERSDYPHLDNYYPKLNLTEFVESTEQQIAKTADEFNKGLDSIIDTFRYKTRYSMDFSVGAVVAYLYGDDEVMLEEIRDDYELNQMQTVIRLTKEFIEKSLKTDQMFKRMAEMWGFTENYHMDTYDLYNLVEKVQSIARLEFSRFNEGSDDSVTAYMEAFREIDNAVEAGLEPVDILDNWSAGWLSPEGDYYALNGEIANMLHNQIGDALQEQGIVPMYESDQDKELDIKANPDSWLEQHGWVKIHGNWILYGGMFNHKLNKENVPMTDTQKDIIADYIENCHACEVKMGLRQLRFSVGQFRAMDKIALHKNFEF